MLSATLLSFFRTRSPFEQLGDQLHLTQNVVKAKYRFDDLAGEIGSVNLLDDDGNEIELPAGAIIQNVLIDTLVTPTSGGAATIALSCGSAGDLKGATAIASYTGLIAGVPVDTAATSVKLAAAAKVSATIAVDTLTDGEIDVYIRYLLGEAA